MEAPPHPALVICTKKSIVEKHVNTVKKDGNAKG